VGRTAEDLPGLKEYHGRLRDLAVETGRPITWGLFSRREAPEIWRHYLDLLDETASLGGRMFAQVHSRALSVVLSFKTNLPFDRLPVWKDLRALPLSEQKIKLRDPDLRRKLVEAARERDQRRSIGAEPRQTSYEWIFVMDSAEGPHRSVAQVAQQRGVDPVEAMIDLSLEKHPRTVVTFSDSGAHVSQIMDASLQTHVLSHWVRGKQAITLEEGVRMLTLTPATYWGFADRGLIREGMAADMVVFDPDTVAPEMPEVVNDLPAGARRLVQKSKGFAATVVNGEVVLRDGKPTGALPGKLLRGPLARS
jgi:N-acyl-D-aspartate/D-glutamate deacylase